MSLQNLPEDLKGQQPGNEASLDSNYEGMKISSADERKQKDLSGKR
jgi:hypothetical protein